MNLSPFIRSYMMTWKYDHLVRNFGATYTNKMLGYQEAVGNYNKLGFKKNKDKHQDTDFVQITVAKPHTFGLDR